LRKRAQPTKVTRLKAARRRGGEEAVKEAVAAPYGHDARSEVGEHMADAWSWETLVLVTMVGSFRCMIRDPSQVEEIHAHNERLHHEHAEIYEQKKVVRKDTERLQACTHRHNASLAGIMVVRNACRHYTTHG
jgi:hypothetical protein